MDSDEYGKRSASVTAWKEVRARSPGGVRRREGATDAGRGRQYTRALRERRPEDEIRDCDDRDDENEKQDET
jgi:hypothetical protein